MPAHLTQYAELTSRAAGDMHGTPVALLPVGAVEPHGPHAPLGTDTLISSAVCERAALRLADDADVRPLILPAVGYGVTELSRGFPGSVGITAGALETFVADVCRAIQSQRVKHCVIVNSHFEPAHVAALRRAAEVSGSTLFDVTRRRLAARLTDEFRSGAAHAGRYETSIVLALRPELVDVATMRALPPLHVDMPARMAAGGDSFRALGMDEAYCGAPADATADEGERSLETLSGMLVEMIRQVVAA